MESEAMSTDPLLEHYEKNFKWTPELETSISLELIHFKPFGIKKFLNTQIIRNNIRKKHGVSIPPTRIWEYCASKCDLKAAESKEISNLNVSKKSFALPEEYEPLISARLDKVKKKQVKIGINDEMNKCKLNSGPVIRSLQLTELNVPDCSSRSVTPETSNRTVTPETSNRSVTPETNSRKTNLLSSDKDQKSKLSFKKKSTLSFYVNPHVELEHYKSEILEKPVIELKSKNLVQNKNELKQGKNKTPRSQLTAQLI